MTAERTEDELARMFKEGLSKALQESVAKVSGRFVHGYVTDWMHTHDHKIPAPYRVECDRTYGYRTVVTVLKTLDDEGLKGLCKCWLPFTEIQDGCKQVLGHDVPEDLQKTRLKGRVELEAEQERERQVRERLKVANTCLSLGSQCATLLMTETDKGRRRMLRKLQGQCDTVRNALQRAARGER